MDAALTVGNYDAEACKIARRCITQCQGTPKMRVFVEAYPDGTGLITKIFANNAGHARTPTWPNFGILIEDDVAVSRDYLLDVSNPNAHRLFLMMRHQARFTYPKFNAPPEIFLRGVVQSSRDYPHGYAVVLALEGIDDPTRLRAAAAAVLRARRVDPEALPAPLTHPPWVERGKLVVQITRPVAFEMHSLPHDLPEYVEWVVPLLPREPACQATKKRARAPTSLEQDLRTIKMRWQKLRAKWLNGIMKRKHERAAVAAGRANENGN